ncbi:trans-1,2-dihydrobenzene-1,2-diol dehydrogenase-like [Paramacrobiotus metropolitanus]|uniref:trans-1,2-dihydrobenzene-1,2-diol dehydrogenase-like n=1 Tax=Paramacrobiotus metropolitanus TaxID=2943436 RepID=UPI002445A657|nr:trans-1,2-dihydrobenzene-1,2-diol dehydrogenase-like [Paramacrobiotus metropolitanus]XP_055351633.1 trans-1,2-dihydrobenzene-1,2-diol dehydrogenase-like [Paramacrobiotus metropolitanus]
MAPLRWGMVGCGEISNDFASCLQSLPREEHQLVAAAASDKEKAKAFANDFGFQKHYGSYAELAADPDVDTVYIGTINPNHYEICKMFLNHNKRILCEKPLTLKLEHTKELIALAEQKKIFFQEAFWSRFFPLYKQLREDIKAKSVGEVKLVTAIFGIKMDENPSAQRLVKKELGGGSLMDIGGYCTQAILLAYGPEMPENVQACAIMNKEGVDQSVTVTLQWKDGRMAQFATTFFAKVPSELKLYGEKGYITVKHPFWSPTDMVVTEVKEIDKDERQQKYNFPLPKVEHKLEYPHGEGMTYEAQEVYQCIQKGLLESPLFTHQESIVLATIEDRIKKAIGLSYDELYVGQGAPTTHPQ